MTEEEQWQHRLNKMKTEIEISAGVLNIKSSEFMEEKFDIQPLKLAVLERRKCVDKYGYSKLIYKRFNWKWECSICKSLQQRLSQGCGFSEDVEDKAIKNEKYCQRCTDVIYSFDDGWIDSAAELAEKFQSIAFRKFLRRYVRK